MNDTMRYILLSLFTLLYFSSSYAGGGWPQPKGDGYFKISQWWMISDQHYTDSGLIDPNITTGFFSTSIYGEYGFTDRLTGIIYAPLFARTYTNNQISQTTNQVILEGEAINGIGDIDISLKYGLTKPGKGIAIAATLTLGLPLGKEVGGTQENLQLGDGEFNQMLGIDAGTGWKLGNTPMYANTYVGFNNRNNGYSDEIRFGAELGAQFFNEKLWLIGRIKALESRKNEPNSGLQNAASLFANNTEYTAFELEAAYNIKSNLGVSVGYGGALRGELIFANPSYSIGVFLKI